MTAAPTRISPREAAGLILDALTPLPVEEVALRDADGRVLGGDVTSPLDIPPWDNSGMDGYAVRSADIEPGAVLSIVETVPAGGFPTRRLGAGECTRLFTGAPIPEGADGVIRQEDTTPLDGGRVRVDQTRDAGRNLRRRGEDVRRGAVVLRRGDAIGPIEAGLLASVAQATVRVHRRPVVAVLGSGDELAELEEREAILAGRKIASSNSYVMRAMVRAAGAAPLDLGIARDDPADVRERVAGAAAADLLVTSAGMSVGAHDHLRALLESSGSGMRFWRLRSRPGAPVGFGMVHGKPWIGLPGNPVSTAVTFELFVRPAIRKLAGHRRWFRQPIRVRAGERMETPGQLQHFLRVVLDEGDPVPTARLTGPQGSGILSSMVRADALLVVPEDRERVEPGDELPALPLRGERHTEQVPY